jgi:hypothetical protein
MPTIVDVVNPMLCAVVPAEILGVFEQNPLTINLPVSDVILNLVEHPVRQHHLSHVVAVPRAVDKKRFPLISCTNNLVWPNGFDDMYWSM